MTLRVFLLTLVVAAGLCACGTQGSSSTPRGWDQATWDQATWQ